MTAQRFIGISRNSGRGALLRHGPEPLSVVWMNPEQSVWVVGLGVAGTGGGLVECDAELPAGPWFGGWPFAGPAFSAWVLPEVLVWWNGRRTGCAAFGPAGVGRQTLEERLNRLEEVEPVVARSPAKRMSDGRLAYEALVKRAIDRLGSDLTKLVVAREIAIESAERISERAVLKSLEARNPSAWTFLIRHNDGSSFVGSSPELLCEVQGRRLRTEALAGTSMIGEASGLLRSEKDLREHQAVVDDIRARLDRFVCRLDVPSAPQLKRLPSLVHLHTPMEAELRPGVLGLDVASALHPTPAVAGSPRPKALEWLREHEGFERGWYSGVVGAMGNDSLTLAVALRSATLRDRIASVYVGAGVVKGSTPEGEWLETERKAKTMFDALGVAL